VRHRAPQAPRRPGLKHRPQQPNQSPTARRELRPAPNTWSRVRHRDVSGQRLFHRTSGYCPVPATSTVVGLGSSGRVASRLDAVRRGQGRERLVSPAGTVQPVVSFVFLRLGTIKRDGPRRGPSPTGVLQAHPAVPQERLRLETSQSPPDHTGDRPGHADRQGSGSVDRVVAGRQDDGAEGGRGTPSDKTTEGHRCRAGDERPKRVTDMRGSVKGEVIA